MDNINSKFDMLENESIEEYKTRLSILKLIDGKD